MVDPGSVPQEPAPAVFDKRANRGFAHLINATKFTLRGLAAAFRHEAAFRQELAVALLLLPAAFYVASDLLETALLIVSLLAVLAVELLNSALEAVVDRIGPEYHELAGRAKDMGSAAVGVTLLAAGLLWLVLLWQNFPFS